MLRNPNLGWIVGITQFKTFVRKCYGMIASALTWNRLDANRWGLRIWSYNSNCIYFPHSLFIFTEISQIVTSFRHWNLFWNSLLLIGKSAEFLDFVLFIGTPVKLLLLEICAYPSRPTTRWKVILRQKSMDRIPIAIISSVTALSSSGGFVDDRLANIAPNELQNGKSRCLFQSIQEFPKWPLHPHSFLCILVTKLNILQNFIGSKYAVNVVFVSTILVICSIIWTNLGGHLSTIPYHGIFPSLSLSHITFNLFPGIQLHSELPPLSLQFECTRKDPFFLSSWNSFKQRTSSNQRCWLRVPQAPQILPLVFWTRKLGTTV